MDVCLYALLGALQKTHAEILGDNLVGLYLHGSIAFGCYNPRQSDVDYIAVVREPLEAETRLWLLDAIYRLNRSAPPKGIEMSVVLREHCQHFIYPTPFLLHFSNAHRAAYERDPRSFCETMHGTDMDLAAHFTVIRHKGVALCGPPIQSVFGEVPWENYLDSILVDVSDACDDVCHAPVYTILNLCRVCAAVEEKRVLSKAEGGAWGLTHFDAHYAPLLRGALDCYRTGAVFEPSRAVAVDFCRSVLAEIHRSMVKDNRNQPNTHAVLS